MSRLVMLISLLLLTFHAISALPNSIQASPESPPWRHLKDQAAATNTPRGVKDEKPNVSNFLSDITAPYFVNGTAIPDVNFDAGESYAGQLPLTNDSDEQRKLFFWFFPAESENPRDVHDVIIWLNGGPGCSSMMGLVQENGPFVWQPGTFRPISNPWAWHRLAHVVYVDQPIGTGFSVGPVMAKNEDDISADFLLFWRQFIDTFQLWDSRVFLTGESYAGMYVPYITKHMLDVASETDRRAYFDVQGMLLFSPLITSDLVQAEAPAVRFAEHWRPLHPFGDAFYKHLADSADQCGYTSYLDKYLQYPPPPPDGSPPARNATCAASLWSQIAERSLEINPCWNMYHVASTCPLPWDVLGFPGSYQYLSPGATLYFNRTDVQRALNVEQLPDPPSWKGCSDKPVFVAPGDTSVGSSVYALPEVIDRTQNVIIAHGAMDFVLLANGTLLGLQNMFWGGQHGFQEPPDKSFYVPWHPYAVRTRQVLSQQNQDPAIAAVTAAWGVVGTTGTERGLTFVRLDMSGHMGPADAPSASMRMVEVLLGKTESLQSTTPFLLMNQTPA